MTKVHILVNTRVNRVFCGRGSIIDVDAETAANLVRCGLAEEMYFNNLDEPLGEQAKEAKPKAKRVTKK